MKIISKILILTAFVIAPAATCLALPSGHSRHACAPSGKVTRGAKPYHVGYNAKGQVVCIDGPSKGSIAR